ncbi:MAG TPA: type IV pilus twitching motility protein PilT [Candidatus Sumerlaeota bacterium]|nr:MAG: Twitching mobility protein [candidate division BRC1 bacterium ADurb.BinA292]HOE95856.1 type IV pilus twitching motility protein PilT [Candidatus Sumerlaeota bacterium]HOR26896.1 type IV pilus twitching motility protein PilT [Candidatus Sumerlaeota bacterium]HPK01410.1 type IV pilus twitching motility protein PilT [Candidatus Sumerlaeota bacterium]
MPPQVQDLLTEATRQGASDLHLVSWSPPIMRLNGTLVPMDMAQLTPQDLAPMILGLLNEEQRNRFGRDWELDLSLTLRNVGRFRVNVHRQRGAIEAAFRIVTDRIRTIRQLGLPPIIEELARRESGLILITGPTGSGKSTTLAAMIDQINQERRCMIVTIEDPIEYVFRHRNSIIKQRELGIDTRSFAVALRESLRQDPDVIVVGEMRDLETIATALTAAETGHLVLTTIHTPDVVQTVDRVVDVFPPHQQEQIRMQFANTIQGIIAQQLLPITGGQGRVAACEVLVATLAVRKILRSAKAEQLHTALQTGTELGMITMDKSLKLLYQRGLISLDMALAKARFPESFEHI